MKARAGSAKARLQSGAKLYGCFLNANSPTVATVMAKVGYDCLMIDGEHSPVGYETAENMLNAISHGGSRPLMRVAANDAVRIKQALDLGLDGVMAPSVNSKREAEALVEACLYPPRGRRGVAVPVIRAAGYGTETVDYIAHADDDLLVIAQIETRQAVENVEAIAAVPGIDLLFIGPYDLSASLGHLGEPDHPEARRLIDHAAKAIKAAGKWLGAIPTKERPADMLFAAGFDLVLGGADIALLREAAQTQVQRFRPKGA